MVTSFFPGRVRLRADVFKDPVIVSKACDIVCKYDAVKNVESNLRTGSILLEYDAEQIPVQELQAIKPFALALQKEAQHYSPKKREALLALLEECERRLAAISK